MLKLTKTFYRNVDAFSSGKYRYIINQGGSSSSKTFSTLQILSHTANTHDNVIIDIASESVPHLKRGVLRDLPIVFDQMGLNLELMLNRSDNFITFPNGSKINLIALDNPGKARGSRRDILFINEANLIPYETAEQLLIRTHDTIFIDYNPTNAFWVHNEIIPKNPDRAILIKSTYKDNQFLTQAEIDELESRRGDGNNNFWRVYGLGELGIAEGLVFENVTARTISDEELSRFDEVYQGIDWGYIHPFVFIKCCYDDENKKLYVFDEVYQSRMSLQASMDAVREKQVYGDIIADSANPQSIGEFWDNGFSIFPANKTPGSRDFGYRWLQSLNEIVIDPVKCPNTLHEFLTMEYLKDKDGKYINDYPKICDDGVDAIRYAMERAMPYGIK
ncbi:MAG: phage terminase large subunit [Clostridia bacterium]|nr:phage terminase large subunit [Clostridia bacterium]